MSGGRIVTILAWSWALLWLCANHSTAQAPAASSLEFRRVFVPESELKELTSGYLPVKNEEFQQLLSIAGAAPRNPGTANVRLIEAAYSARLEQSDLVAGTAQLRIVHDNRESAILNLAPCTLAVSAATWGADAAAARFGNDASGKPAVVVEPSVNQTAKPTESELRLAWTQRGARDPSGALVFDLQTPACPSAKLTLDLPANVTPQVTHGVVSKAAALHENGKRQLWTIELGGHTQFTLSIISDESLQRNKRYVLERKATTYDVTPQALEATFEHRFDVYQEPLRQISFLIDAALRIAEVTIDDEPLTWTLSPTANSSSQRLVVEFPEPLTGRDNRLRIKTLAEVVREKKWKLPTLVAQDVIWQEGTVVLQVADRLELCDVHPLHAQQSLIGNGGDPDAESLRFQMQTIDAAIEILVRDRPARIDVNEGLTLKWDGPHLTGRLVSDLKALDGETFDLSGQLSPGWIIDSVETVPAEALDDWSVSTTDGRGSILSVRLARAIDAERPVQFKVLGHRRAPQRNERLAPREFRMLQWQPVARDRRLVSVQAESQQQLALSGDIGLERIDVRSLSEAQRTLIETQASRLVFLDSSAAPNFALALRSETPRFTAEASAHVTLSRESLAETYAIRIVPDATPISRVVVRFSAIMPRVVEWKSDRDAPGVFTARQLAADDSELWELSFLSPQTAPLTVTAERQTVLRPGDPARSLPLVAVNEAETQQGEVIIQAIEGAQPVIEEQGLTRALLDAGQPNVFARFRYQYAPDQRLSIAHISPHERRSLAWAWRQRLVARVAAVDKLVCTAYYEIENRGEPQMFFGLPDGAMLRHIRVDGVRIPTAVGMANELTVAMPTGQRYANVQIEYALPKDPVHLWQSISVPAPETRLPILETQTDLWLSPDLSLSGSGATSSGHWRTRLFGLLARPATTNVPSLFSQDAWHLPNARGRITDEQRQKAMQCQGNLAAALALVAKEDEPSWGALLKHYNDQAESLPLRIDAQALSAIGVYGDTPIAADVLANPDELLLRSGLALLLFQESAALTTRQELAELEPATKFSDVFFIATKTDAASLEFSSVTVTAWLAEPQGVRSPWRVEGLATTLELEAAGWQGYRLENYNEVVVYRWKDIQSFAWGLFLAWVGVTAWIVRKRLPGYLALVAGTAIIALWLPTMIAPLGTALFLGTVVGGFVGRLFTRPRKPPAVQAIREPSASRRVSVTSIVLVMFALAWRQVSAQDAPAVPMIEAFRVLIPVDSEQKPAGAYVYLPRAFYDALARQAKNAKAVPQGWVVYEAVYRGSLRSTAPGKLQFADLVASYDLEVFQPGTRVLIGLERDRVHLLDDRVTLEGAPVRVDWLESGEGFTFPVEKPGRYRLEVGMQPAATIAGARQQVDLRIPQLSRSTLLLKAPAEAVGVQVTGAQGHTYQEEPGSWRVDLGPASALAVYWPSGEGEESPKKDVEVSQLLWWRVQPGNVVLESQWKFSSGAEPLSEVRLIADRRLKMLPLADDQPVAEQSIRQGDVQAIHLVLKEPKQREVTLRASFTVVDASGVGQLVLPRLEAVADRTSRRWLAVSASEGLEASETKGIAPGDVTPQEFAVAWGGAEVPQATYRMPEAQSIVTLDVRERPAIATVKQALTYAIDSHTIRAELEAIVQVNHGAIHQHRLRLPANWNIENATVTEAGISKPVRCSDCGSGEQTLFLPAGMSGEHRLLITAAGQVPPGKGWSLPEMRLLSAEREPPLVFIERASQMAVKVTAHPGYEEVADTTAGPSSILWRRVAVLRPLGTPTSRQIQLRTDRQSPTLRARQVISLQAEGEHNSVVVDIRGTITGGALETLRLEVPADMRGARLSVPAKTETIAIPGQTRQHWIASLEEPLQGPFAVQLTIPLGSLTVDRLQIPEIRLLDAESVETFVALPTTFNAQQLTWETRSLQSATLPRNEYPAIAHSAQVMAAPSNRFQATVKRFERIAGVPQVRLADVALHLVSSQAAYGVASLDLEPAGLGTCALRVPAGQTLVHVTVNGMSVVPMQTRPGEFRVALQHERLPQHLEVLFTTTSPDGLHTVEAPSLVNVPVERTLWTITPTNGQPIALADVAPRVDADRQASFRIKNAAALLEQAASQAGDASGNVEQAAAWFANWCHRSTRLQADFTEEHANDESSGSALAADLQSLGAEAQALGQQWGASEALTTALTASTQPRSLADIYSSLTPDAQSSIRAMLPGASSSLQLALPPQSAADTIYRALSVALISLLFLTAATLARSTALKEVIARSPQVIGVAIGLAWWFLLAPAAVGLIIAALFALASLAFAWPRSRDFSRPGQHSAFTSRPR